MKKIGRVFPPLRPYRFRLPQKAVSCLIISPQSYEETMQFYSTKTARCVSVVTLHQQERVWPDLLEGGGGFSEGVDHFGGLGAFFPRKFLKFETLNCHFLHSALDLFPALDLFVKFDITVLVFWANIKKSAALYGGPPYWCLNIFSRTRESIVSL